MHIECEKGSAHNPRRDRSRARPSRRGPSPTDQRQAEGQQPAGGDITLEHVLVAAKRRRAPITVETAGYVALAVADSLVAAPATVLPKHVLIDADGNVSLRGARGRGDERSAEQSVRALLATLLGVTVGSSPALSAASRRTNHLGVSGLIAEVEAALIPVNRSAARRAIGRLAREVERAHVQLPERKSDERQSAPAPKQRQVVQKSIASVPAPPPPAFVEEPVFASEPRIEEATDIDARVSPVPSPVETPWLDLEDSTSQEAAVLLKDATPQLATYDPRGASAAEVVLDEPENLADPHDLNDFDELLGTTASDAHDDLLTYEPPEALDDASLDFGTASPPDVGLSFPDEDATLSLDVAEALQADIQPGSIEGAEPEAIEPEACAPEACESELSESELCEPDVSESELCEVSEPEACEPAECEPESDPEAIEPPLEAETVAADAPDRVNELLAGFASTPERSSKDVAGELKNMLGLAPTPPPPTTTSSDEQETERAPDPPDEPLEAKPLPPVEYARPRNPKLSLMLTFVLLVLAIAAMVALYVLYPALLLGH